MFRNLLFRVAPSLLLALAFAGTASATIAYNQNITAIYGTGNSSAFWAADIENNIELALRAHVRFPVAQDPVSAPAGNYGAFNAGSEGGPTGNASWNFDWSINTDLDGPPGLPLSGLTYALRLDTDPGAGTSFVAFDPINVLFADNSIGNNGTASGAGAEAVDASGYASLIANNNLAQNSGRFNFFLTPAQFNPNIGGQYTIQLAAFSGNTLLAQTSIDVFVQTPEPASMLSMTAGLGALALFAWRRKKSALQN